MTDLTLDPRVLYFLEDGPTRAPAGANELIAARVATTPQDRPWLRLRGRPVRVGAGHLAAAAAVIAIAVGGVAVLRDPISDVVAPPPAGDSLLADHPEVRTILEAEGGPADAEVRTTIGTLPQGEAFLLAASCTGGDTASIQVIDPFVRRDAAATGEELFAYENADVPCDGTTTTTPYDTVDVFVDDPLEVDLVAPAGTTWRVEVGQLRQLPSPIAGGIEPAEGDVVIIADEPRLYRRSAAEGFGGIGVDPVGSRQVIIHVQCSGDPIRVLATFDDAEPVEVGRSACDDAGAALAIPLAADGPFGVGAASDGFTWVQLAATRSAVDQAARPPAPALPEGYGDVLFADGDGQNVSFGSLGGSTQTVIRLEGANVGMSADGLVAIAVPGADGRTDLELWSIADAERVRTLANVDGERIFRSWVDPTHGQVFFGTATDLGEAAFYRVALDGSGLTELARTPVGVREAADILSVDDSVFVAQWCPLVGACERAVVDAATLAVDRTTRTDAGFCTVEAAVAGRLIGVVPGCDATDVTPHLAAVDLGDGAETPLADGWNAATALPGPDGPRVVVLRQDESSSTVEVVPLAGGEPRAVATFDHEAGFNASLAKVRLPAGDWVLLAGPLGENPATPVGRSVPILLNVETGEQIVLVNLPGD